LKAKKKQQPPQPVMTRLAEIVRETGVLETVRRSDVPRSTVFRLLAGTHPPKLETIEQLLAACGYRLEIVPVEPPAK